jgi:stage V sporulation protein D (sporulation-specific penicillin-binding protein)
MVWAVCIVTILCFGIVSISLFKEQIIDYEFYSVKAEAQQMADTAITANRGTIYDCDMKVLAQSATVYNVIVSPADTPEDKKELISSGLSEILGIEKEVLDAKLAKEKSYYEVIQKKVDKATADKIRSYVSENKITTIYLYEDSKRYYTYGNFASHILGFTGSDNQGLDGLESYYDKVLTGTPGRIISAKNAVGNNMPYDYDQIYEPTDGYSLVLTLNEVIQHYLEKHISVAVREHNVQNRAIGLVMDVNTGAILGMATKSDYDPNDPFTIYNPDKSAEADMLSGDTETPTIAEAQQAQWRNKAISDVYEPGSVFKIVTASAGLEEQVVKLSDGFTCSGHFSVSGTRFNCHDRLGHGNQSFLQAISNSCNPVFIMVGQRLGADKFYKYFNAFGLTKKTGIDLPGEASPIYYKQNQLGPVQLASVSFGQSSAITAIQMITAVSAAVNGGTLYKPYLVSQVLDNSGNVYESFEPTALRQVISKETSALVSSALEETVLTGGGRNAYIKGYRIGGKSGTAEKLSGDKDARVASFVAVAPADDPQIAVLVILDEPKSYSSYGGTIAAPVVAGILQDILPYVGIERQYSEEELQNLEVTVTNVVGKAPHAAQTTLNQYGLNSTIIGSGETVIKQVPAGGSTINRGGNVLLYTTEDTSSHMVTVPDLTGLTATEANNRLLNSGLNIKIVAPASSTNAVAYKQSVEAGKEVVKGTVITVEFIDRSGTD